MTTDLQTIKANTQQLMRKLGRAHLGAALQERGWSFRFDRAKRRLGVCKCDEKVISLSQHFAAEQGWDTMEDVARHEIAHALDFETRGRSDHSEPWKAWARRCGADPSRLYEAEPLRDAVSKYVGQCPRCGAQYSYHRRLSRAHACPACCRVHTRGRYDERFRLILVERATGRAVEEPPSPQHTPYRAKYTGTCPHCGSQVGFARRLKRVRACKRCCDAHSGGRFDARFVFQIRQNY